MSYLGQSIPSITNDQLVAGKGTFVDDVQLPGLTTMAVLQSPYAHARIVSIDASAAEALPGRREGRQVVRLLHRPRPLHRRGSRREDALSTGEIRPLRP
jgi:xanthine dehydrogenase molybdopterin-binding subunit B